jgi:PAS domain S-box-containing protein
MSAQTKNRRGFWQSLFRREGSKAPEETPAVSEPEMQVVAPDLQIAPDDPILAYLADASGVVEIEKLDLDSPALREMKAADVKLVVPLVSQGELIGLLNLGPRLSQQEYSADDRKLLSDLSTQTAPALRIARLVHQQREAETRYRTLVEQTPAITYVQEPIESSNPKAVTYVSPQYETILGYPSESQMIDEEHWLRTLHPEDRERVLAEEARTDQTGRPFGIEYRMFARDGSVVWVRDEAVLVRDEEGGPLYWLGIQYDITERKRFEEALKASEERYRTFIGQSTEGIWRFELEEPCPVELSVDEQVERFYRHAYLAECNDAMAAMYGYERAEELLGARLGDLLPREIPENVAYLEAFVRAGYRMADAESSEVDREGEPSYFLNNLTGM